ncbi:MAG: secondary thiamine-phosphate synthase enzyme YjbQ [Armatimonadota bacterium]|nr:secondary thiamine-phosphate synthase enzyme YjbQ [Armatimonadota bacterium]MDR7548620.1 secondary thiamine-phosphate synthase enzyme YjbQ [Armatimonadota bacterium]
MPVRWLQIAVTSKEHTQAIDITEAVARACAADGARDGLVLVYCPHTTAGVLIQEAEPGLLRDLEGWLAKAVPPDAPYRHNRADDNAASHLRAVVAGSSAIVPLQGGRLGLGTWQRIIFVELDGPRRREVRLGLVT